MSPQEIVDRMMSKDAFSRWLGVEVIAVADGSCTLAMTVRAEMLNGFSIAHGGIAYSLADSALAFASNGGGSKSVSIHTGISHVKSVRENDRLVAEAVRTAETGKLGHYSVTVKRDGDGETVALFTGTVYRTSKSWEE